MGARQTRVLILALAFGTVWCLVPPPPADASKWLKLEEISAGVNFFRHSNKTFHRHIRIVDTKKKFAESYKTMLKAAGKEKLGEAIEKAYQRETEAIARANVREIQRVRHVGKNLVAFLSSRQRRTYNTARAVRVLRLDKEVQDATLERRLLEAQIDSLLKKEDLEDDVKYQTGLLMKAKGVQPEAYFDMEKYEEKWITPETKQKLENNQRRLARESAEAQAAASAAGEAPGTSGDAGTGEKPPPMVSASEVSAKKETEQSKKPETETPRVDEGAGDGETRTGTTTGFTCAIDTDRLSATARPKECYALVEAARETCLDGCDDDPDCEEVCNSVCDDVREECVMGFTCEISMSELLGAGDRKECYDKVEIQRGGCLEDCEGETECEAVCNTACDRMRNEKCAKMKDVFQPQVTRD